MTGRRVRTLHCNTAGVGLLCRPALQVVHKGFGELAQSGFYEGKYQQMDASLGQVRVSCAALLRTRADRIALAHSTTDGLGRLLLAFPWASGDIVAVNRNPFLSTLALLSVLRDKGVHVHFIGGSEGAVGPQDIATLPRKARVVLVEWVHWISGWRNSIAVLGSHCHRVGVPLVVDAAQALGGVPVDLNTETVAAIVCGGHKWLRAPEGTGFIYIHPSFRGCLRPCLPGHRAVEALPEGQVFILPTAQGLETGTVCTVAFLALKAAIDDLLATGYYRRVQQIDALVDVIHETLAAKGAIVVSAGEPEHRSGIVSFKLPSTEPQAVVERLLAHGIVAKLRGARVRLSPDPDIKPRTLAARLRESLMEM